MATTETFPLTDTPLNVVVSRSLGSGTYSLQNVGNEIMYVSEQDATPLDLSVIGYHILPPTTEYNLYSFTMQVDGNQFYLWSPKGRKGKASITEAP